jgi:hypothetical protein
MRSLFLLPFLQGVLSAGFPWESIQLSEDDVKNRSELAFGASAPGTEDPAKCKVYPGDSNWPSSDTWRAFNASLGGALIKPLPPAAVCYRSMSVYDTTKCDNVMKLYTNSILHVNDPASVVSPWLEGNNCSPPYSLGNASYNANQTCTSEGFPAYVVNATTVKQIQLAVNFARNLNLRLILK